MLTRHQVEAARARADAATSGPWRDEIGEIVQLTDCGKGYPLNYYPDSATIVELVGSGDCDHSISWLEADRKFMASSRADLPAALDALEEAVHIIGLLLPLAKGYSYANQWESNARCVRIALDFLAAYDADAPTRAGDGGEG